MTAVSAKPPARDRLRPYVSGLALQWLETTPTARHRRVSGSLAFVDISGFTALTERLASKGKVGAEEMSDLLDATFATLLAEAYGYGASLVKWGGDAVLLLFEDAEHAELAARAAYEMRRTMRRIGRLRTSVGVVQLRMSVGINSGEFDFFMAGERHHELLTGGPAATLTALMEQTAEAGEIVVSRATAALLPASCLGDAKGDGVLLRSAPKVARRSRAWVPSSEPADPGDFVDPAIRDQLLTEVGDCEHRQVAVGFVEISGVDDLLARQGPGAVAAALHDLVTVVQEECAHHAVTFWETDISADGFKIMLVAGAPRSTGHDEEGMLRATRAILDRYDGPVRVRIGVNCGRVFSGGFGPYFRRTWSVKGDAVNLAARVMGKAETGALIATDALLRRVNAGVEADLLSPFLVKGKREPIRASVVRVVHKGRVIGADVLTPLIGRTAELDVLLGAARSAAEGSGATVSVAGPPGIGKSRLVDHACSRLDPKTLVFRGFGDAYESSTPYYGVRRLLRAAIGLDLAASDDEVARRVAECTQEFAPHLKEYLALLALPFGVTLPETKQTRDIQEQFRAARSHSLVIDLLSASLSSAIVLIVDDVQYADEASVALLCRLAIAAEARRWLVIVTGREVQEPLSEVASHCLDIPPLATREGEALVVATPGGEGLPPHLVQSVVARGEGNPLFLLELTAAASSTGLVELPSTLEESLTAQIDALEPFDRRLLRTVAVLGSRFDEVMAAELLGFAPQPEQWLALTRFLVRHADGSWRFRTSLARDAAYEALPFRQRVTLHGLASSALIAASQASGEEQFEALSLHCFAAQRFEDAARYSRIAGDRARSVYANADALKFYERALEAARRSRRSKPVGMAELHEAIGEMHRRLDSYEQAVVSLCRARKLTPPFDVSRRAALALSVALALEPSGSTSRVTRWLAVALREAQIAQQRGLPALRELEARVSIERAWISYRLGRDAAARALSHEAAKLARLVDSSAVLARAMDLQMLLDVRAGVAIDVTRAATVVDMYDRAADLVRMGSTWNNAGMSAYFEGDWIRAAQCYQQAAQLFERCGDERNCAIAAANLAEILIEQGRLDEAEGRLVSALRVWRAVHAADVGFAAALLARLTGRAGRLDEAADYLREAENTFAIAGERLELAEVVLGGVELALLAGDLPRAHQLLAVGRQRLIEAARVAGRPTAKGDIPMTPLTAAYLRLQGALSWRSGDPQAAAGHVRAAVEIARHRQSGYDVVLGISMLTEFGVASPGDQEEADAGRRRLGIVRLPNLLTPRQATADIHLPGGRTPSEPLSPRTPEDLRRVART